MMRVLVGDDQELVRAGFSLILERAEMTVVGGRRRARQSSWRSTPSPTSYSWMFGCPGWTG